MAIRRVSPLTIPAGTSWRQPLVLLAMLIALLALGGAAILWGLSRPATTIVYTGYPIPAGTLSGPDLKVAAQFLPRAWTATWEPDSVGRQARIPLLGGPPSLAMLIPSLITIRDTVYLDSDTLDRPAPLVFPVSDLRGGEPTVTRINDIIRTSGTEAAAIDSSLDTTWIDIEHPASGPPSTDAASIGIAVAPSRANVTFQAPEISLSAGAISAPDAVGNVEITFSHDAQIDMHFFTSLSRIRLVGGVNSGYTTGHSGAVFWLGSARLILPAPRELRFAAFELVPDGPNVIQFRTGGLIRTLSVEGIASLDLPEAPTGALLLGGTRTVPVHLLPHLQIRGTSEATLQVQADSQFTVRLRSDDVMLQGEQVIPRRLDDLSGTLIGFIISGYLTAIVMLTRRLVAARAPRSGGGGAPPK